MATDTAVSEEGLFIPVSLRSPNTLPRYKGSANVHILQLIDFSKFLNGTQEERQATAKAVLSGFQGAGFIYLKNHPISAAALKHAFAVSANFFRQAPDDKMAVCWTTPEANRGYSAPGREKVTNLVDLDEVGKVRAAAPDLKESFEIGREGEPGHPNRWPREDGEMGNFRADMLGFYDQCKDLHVEVMRAIAVGMGLDDKFFDSFVDVGDNTLRLLHYPEDYGSITLLFQDNRGGLQVRSPTGRFVDATPIEGTVVVNAGDLLARWSNDTIKSTIHRVVEPPSKGSDTYPPRYSIAYFCNPNFKSHIEAIPGTYATEAEKKYEGINSGDYLVQRLTATY
ncbi:hypothetical protein S40285_01151 [Stachybotrys chlorohalonatus IBT 40285]|uniref:Fe2OG dioxygenase domain-containing protein n=1 Tax=Stachybotrys chlorohalonatus (strain IBT 40285) TaxID=1283841 RepID=A0A084QY04_STAC4|nr:hypothetical protein S40285_01151 [Stachybotrys chlorohalonata IBT 40285]